MTRHHHFIRALPMAAFGLILAGCDSKAEREVERQADAIDESYKAEADLKDALAPTAGNAAQMRNEADALRDKGEATKERLDAMAEELDSVPGK